MEVGRTESISKTEISIPDAILRADIWANMRFPQMYIAQITLVGELVVDLLPSSDFSIRQLQDAQITQDQLSMAMEKAVQGHAAYGIEPPAAHFTDEKVKQVMEFPLARCIEVLQTLGHWAITDEIPQLDESSKPIVVDSEQYSQEIERAYRDPHYASKRDIISGLFRTSADFFRSNANESGRRQREFKATEYKDQALKTHISPIEENILEQVGDRLSEDLPFAPLAVTQFFLEACTAN